MGICSPNSVALLCEILHIRPGSVRISQAIGAQAGVIPATALQERIFIYVRLGCVMFL